MTNKLLRVSQEIMINGIVANLLIHLFVLIGHKMFISPFKEFKER